MTRGEPARGSRANTERRAKPHGGGCGTCGRDHDCEGAPLGSRDEDPSRGHGHEHGHDHEHGHEHGHAHGAAELRRSPLKRLVLAFGLTAGFMVIEGIVGWWSGSRALIADAGHMLGDAVALGLAMFAQRIAGRQRSRARTYGSRRAEVLAAFVNGIALAVLALWIFKEAVERWGQPLRIIGDAMLLTAILGLVVNGIAAWILSRGSEGHNTNTRAALFHVLSDALGSVGAITAAVLILAFGWTSADTIASVLIGSLVLYGGWRLIRQTTHVLMEGTPVEIDVAELESTVHDVEGVLDFHDLHVWSISDGFAVMTVHVVVAPEHHATAVVAAVRSAVRDRHGIEHVTVQPEAGSQSQTRSSAAGHTDGPSTPDTACCEPCPPVLQDDG